MTALSLRAAIEHWPLANAFTISRGAKTEAVTVVVEVGDGTYIGRGECVPYARYDETPESVMTATKAMKDVFARGIDRQKLRQLMPPGAARNAIDCALWDLEAKQSDRPVHELAGRPAPQPLMTAFTISLDTPEAMAQAAAKASDWPLLKIKLGGKDDGTRIKAVRHAAPKTELIVDANEGWTVDNLAENFAACAQAGVTLIEQPLPEAEDTALAGIPHPVPICADESAHGLTSLAALKGRYDAVNIKLDKAGGLTEALMMVETATSIGLTVMVGCMVASSLAVAPALLVAQKARFVDLDGALWLAKDRPFGLRYEDYHVYPAAAELWG
jgi:L-alanine-DL-glutamate epimerase-like enolase superfamily enzyme